MCCSSPDSPDDPLVLSDPGGCTCVPIFRSLQGLLATHWYWEASQSSGGTRVPVDLIVGFIDSGLTPADIVEDYPDLSIEDIEAAIAFAARKLFHQPVEV